MKPSKAIVVPTARSPTLPSREPTSTVTRSSTALAI
jgi:hypothetical protein